MLQRFATALFFLCLGLFAPVPNAHADAGLGPHLGVNFEGGDPVFIGLGARVDIARVADSVELQIDPSLAYYFTDNSTLMHFAVSFPFEFKIQDSVVRPFTGAGLSLFYWHANNNSDVRPRLNLIGGLAFALDKIKPFIELRLLLGDGSGFELLGGLFFNL